MYQEVDSDIINQLNKHVIQGINEFLTLYDEKMEIIDKDISSYLTKSGIRVYIFYCAYCRTTGLLSTTKAGIKKDDPFTCVNCGESDPYRQFLSCVDKVKCLQKTISHYRIDDRATENDFKLERIILENCITLLSTGFEIFLKQTYATLMNTRYVKPNENLYDKFIKDVENKFLQYSNILSIYRRELEIDLKGIVGKDTTNITDLIQKRHVIVHNNGHIDKKYIEQTRTTLKLGSPVPIDSIEISRLTKILLRIVQQIFNEYYSSEILAEIIIQTNRNFEEDNRYNVEG